jgi:glucosamine--fructose-6-phosphate aminotransferase (isomerizing)
MIQYHCPNVHTQCIHAAEFSDELLISYKHHDIAVILISQSGETRDIIKCLDICTSKHICTIGVVNVVDSYISRETTCGIYCHAGREVAVASTKSFTCQVLCLLLISLWFRQTHSQSTISTDIIQTLFEFIDQTPCIIDDIIRQVNDNLIQKLLHQSGSMFIAGTKGYDYVVAQEGALKVKEISYIHCEGIYTSELKHGPLALITERFPVVCLISNMEDKGYIKNTESEILSRNGIPIIIGCDPTADVYINMNGNPYGFLWNNIALQYIAYKISISKTINPDMPRNLAKVVTVA